MGVTSNLIDLNSLVKNKRVILENVSNKILFCSKPLVLEELKLYNSSNNVLLLTNLSLSKETLSDYIYSIYLDPSSSKNVITKYVDREVSTKLSKSGFIRLDGDFNVVHHNYLDTRFNSFLVNGSNNQIISNTITRPYGDSIRVTNDHNRVLTNNITSMTTKYSYKEYHVDGIQVHPKEEKTEVKGLEISFNTITSNDSNCQGIIISDGAILNSIVSFNHIQIVHTIGIHSNCSINCRVLGNIGNTKSTIVLDRQTKVTKLKSSGNLVSNNVNF